MNKPFIDGGYPSFFYYEIRNNLVLIIEKKLQKKNMI